LNYLGVAIEESFFSPVFSIKLKSTRFSITIFICMFAIMND